MNAETFFDLMNTLPDDMITAACKASYSARTVQPDGGTAAVSSAGTASLRQTKSLPDSISAPRWITAAALAACMLFAVGVGAVLLHGDRNEMTTQSTQDESVVQQTGTAVVTETTAVTGYVKTMATDAASAEQAAHTTAAEVTEETADGTALPEDGEADAATGQTTTGTVPRTTAAVERQTDFRGMLGHRSSGLSFYQGQEPDYGQLEIELHLEDQWGSFGHAVGSFSIGSGAHANCYTLDTSEVDPNKPGTYYVYVDTVEGAEDDFDSYSEIPQIGLTRGNIHVTMEAHRTSFMITVLKKSTDLHFGFGTADRSAQEFSIPDNRSVQFFRLNNLWEDNDNAEYTFSDPSVAEIVKKNMDVYGCDQVLQIRGLKAGETALTVTAADGRTASCLLRVIPAEEYYIEPAPMTTIAIW